MKLLLCCILKLYICLKNNVFPHILCSSFPYMLRKYFVLCNGYIAMQKCAWGYKLFTAEIQMFEQNCFVSLNCKGAWKTNGRVTSKLLDYAYFIFGLIAKLISKTRYAFRVKVIFLLAESPIDKIFLNPKLFPICNHNNTTMKLLL